MTFGGPYTSGGTGGHIVFDASNSNAIYGSADTVQPPAVNIVMGEYVVGTVAIIGEANAESLLASVTTLESNVGALQRGSGFSAAGKAEIVRLGIPNYSAGVDFSSGYTAPSDGVIVCTYWYNNGVFRVAANNTYIVGGGSNGVVYEVNYITTCAAPVKKGEVLTLWTQGTITVNMKFYPMGA
jgi:hypothetical protein